MRRLRLALILFVIASPGLAEAEETSPWSFNVSATSDYRYRGISQTRLKPALQGGIDYAFANGFYIGTWASTIRWIKDNGVKGPIEIDLYGGYKGEINKDLGYDIGVLQYWYAGNRLNSAGGGGVYKNADTTEIYGALTVGPITGKLSYALTNLFGNHDFAQSRNTRGSTYVEIAGNFALGSGFTLIPHAGYQRVENVADASYADYSITVSKDFGAGVSLSVAGVATDASKSFYVPGAASGSSKYLGKTAFVVALKYAF